jgi:hypothetical protein
LREERAHRKRRDSGDDDARVQGGEPRERHVPSCSPKASARVAFGPVYGLSLSAGMDGAVGAIEVITLSSRYTRLMFTCQPSRRRRTWSRG